MSSETAATTATSTEETNAPGNWKAGVVAGLAGSLAMGVLISLTNSAVIAVAMPALYGLAPPPNPLAGWFVHVSHGTIFGVGFAALAGAMGYGRDATRSVGIGVAYGVVVWVVAAALVMPVWLRAVGFAGAPPFPNFAPPSLLWHVVFGAVLGATYPPLRDS